MTDFRWIGWTQVRALLSELSCLTLLNLGPAKRL
jgi:hypothetical protein